MKKPWWQQEGAIAWALILFFPLGIFMMWRYAPWRNRFKWLWSAAAAIVILFIVAGAVGGRETKDSSNRAEMPDLAPTTPQTGTVAAPTMTTQELAYVQAVATQEGERAQVTTIAAEQTKAAQPTETPEPTPMPKLSWENGPVTEETVRKALDDLDDLGLGRPDINSDNVTFLSVIDAEGFVVAIEFRPGEALSETDFLTIAGESTLVAMAKLFGNPQVQRVKVSAMADLVDAFGNESMQVVTTATINRATANRINWQGLASRQSSDNKHVFCIADEYAIRPVVYNELKDKGCLTGPSRSAE